MFIYNYDRLLRVHDTVLVWQGMAGRVQTTCHLRYFLCFQVYSFTKICITWNRYIHDHYYYTLLRIYDGRGWQRQQRWTTTTTHDDNESAMMRRHRTQTTRRIETYGKRYVFCTFIDYFFPNYDYIWRNRRVSTLKPTPTNTRAHIDTSTTTKTTTMSTTTSVAPNDDKRGSRRRRVSSLW
jgi:hypothetical protein